MKRSRLRNNFLKHRSEVNKRTCNTQKNLFPDWAMQKSNTLRIFTIKKLLSNFLKVTNKGINKEGSHYELTKKFWSFEYVLFWCSKNLGIPQYEDPTDGTSDISESLLKAIAKYKNHSGIMLIKNTFKNLTISSFHYVDKSDIEREITILNNSKASQDSNIPVKIIKDNLDIFNPFMTKAAIT